MNCRTEKTKRQAFTLIELLVVIAIIGVVAAFVLPNFTGAVDRAREVTCRTNLRNLQAAVINYSVANGRNELPHAGSFERHSYETKYVNNQPTADIEDVYYERRGWISWTKGLTNDGWEEYWGKHANQEEGRSVGTSHEDKMNRTVDTLWKSSGGERALDQGTLWSFAGADRKAYRCPVAARYMQEKTAGKKKDTMMVTYAMNEYFRDRRHFPGLADNVDASTLLLFAERRLGVTDGTAKGEWANSVLHAGTSESDFAYTFGEYHGKRKKQATVYGPGSYGIVVFMDGHVADFPAVSTKNKNIAWYLCKSRDDFEQ